VVEFKGSGAPVYDSVQLVNITPISLWFMVDISIVNGVYKPTNIIGEAHPVEKRKNFLGNGQQKHMTENSENHKLPTLPISPFFC